MIEKLKDLTLKKIGKVFMLVENSGDELNFTNVYSMNSTAAWLWENIDRNFENTKAIATAMCAEYEVNEERALADIEKQIAQWRQMGLIK